MTGSIRSRRQSWGRPGASGRWPSGTGIEPRTSRGGWDREPRAGSRICGGVESRIQEKTETMLDLGVGRWVPTAGTTRDKADEEEAGEEEAGEDKAEADEEEADEDKVEADEKGAGEEEAGEDKAEADEEGAGEEEAGEDKAGEEEAGEEEADELRPIKMGLEARDHGRSRQEWCCSAVEEDRDGTKAGSGWELSPAHGVGDPGLEPGLHGLGGSWQLPAHAKAGGIGGSQLCSWIRCDAGTLEAVGGLGRYGAGRPGWHGTEDGAAEDVCSHKGDRGRRAREP